MLWAAHVTNLIRDTLQKKKIVKNITQGSHDYTCYIVKKCMNAPHNHNAYYENTAFTWGTFMEKLDLVSYGEVRERKRAGLAGRV